MGRLSTLDVRRITAAPPFESEVSWDDQQVRTYHLALGAGADPTDPAELRYTYERDLRVLPSFGVVAGGGVGFQVLEQPGVDLDLATVLHGSQEITVHRPLPPSARAVARTRVPAVHDKGSAAVLQVESVLSGEDGRPLLTQRSEIFARGAGGFGGERGPAGRTTPPPGPPDLVIDLPTLPQQALLYRLCGDWNPLHADPATARAAGYDRPVLHGLCTYGIALKGAVDRLLDGDVHRVRGYRARFAGVFYPGETLRVELWAEGADRYALRAGAVERDNAPVLTGGHLIHFPLLEAQ